MTAPVSPVQELPADNKTVVECITDYLASGGLFNPELANHDAVRQLLIDARDEIKAVQHRSFQGGRISYRGFGYGVGSQWGIDSLRSAIRRDGND